MAVDKFSSAAGPQMGLIKLIPTGVTVGSGTASVTATGDINIGSAVSSVTVNGAFSATYDNYLIRIAGGVATSQTDLDIQIGNATSAYNYTSIYTRFDTGVVEGLRANSTTEFRYSGGANSTNLQMDCNIDTPFLARPTLLTARHIVPSANGLTMQTWGYLANNNSYTDIKIFPAAGTLTGGTIRIYGYNQ